MKVGRLNHWPRLQFPAVGYVVEGVASLAGALLIGGGLYVLVRGTFPAWWQKRLLWPVVRVTPTVAHLQGLAAIGLGASILSIVFTRVVAETVGGILILAAFAAYLLALALFLLSAWLSRRPA
jgi:hypothetical protein